MQIIAAGNVNAARSTYRLVVDQLSPGLVEAVVEFANFERRQGDVAAAKKVYEDTLTAAEGQEGEPFQEDGPSAAKLQGLSTCAITHVALADFMRHWQIFVTQR